MISCLMPTYNRMGTPAEYVVHEALECFMRQDHLDSELIICNDTPGQTLVFDHPRVRIFNTPRFANLSAKIQFMIDQAKGDLLCRWDDDDIHLPHRLSYSLTKLAENKEWRPSNYFFDCGHLKEVNGAGNSHVMSLWRRSVLADFIGENQGVYPQGFSGMEDQAFNRELRNAGISQEGERIPAQEIYYLYRWATGGYHLSGKGDSNKQNPHQSHWNEMGQHRVAAGTYQLRPHWRSNYPQDILLHLNQVPPHARKNPLDIQGYFNYQGLYDWITAQAPTGARFVEIGCLSGTSLCYWANKIREQGRRMEVTGVCLGIGVKDGLPDHVYQGSPGLLQNIRECGCEDLVNVLLTSSARAAAMIPNNSLDGAMIDACHRLHSIKTDLQLWWDKIKPGGWFFGHDYIGMGCPDVSVAVDQFFNVPRFSLQSPYADSCWAIQKV